MILALTYVALCLTILSVLTFVYVVEDVRGKRIFLSGTRSQLDLFFRVIQRKIGAVVSQFTNGFMRVLFHYGAHSVLKRVLALIRKLEGRVEEMVRKNKRVAKSITSGKAKNHLDAIAEHREETALSEVQKEEMKAH